MTYVRDTNHKKKKEGLIQILNFILKKNKFIFIF